MRRAKTTNRFHAHFRPRAAHRQPITSPIRTHAGGLYEIYGRDGDEPWKLAPEKLDTSLSLGHGEMGTADWKPGLRDAVAADSRGKTVPAAQIQIAIYKDWWERENDPPRPLILVLAEEKSKGGCYRPGRIVIDGAMWVAAARNAGIALVPVYVVRPTLPHIEPSAMWLYFNHLMNGLAPTGDERTRILKGLATQARDRRGVTHAEIAVNGRKVKASTMWAEGYALATGTAIEVVTAATRDIFIVRPHGRGRTGRRQ